MQNDVPLVFEIFAGVMMAGLLLLLFGWGLWHISRIERRDPQAKNDTSRVPAIYWFAALVPLLFWLGAFLLSVGPR